MSNEKANICRGRCLCGSVQYSVEGKPLVVSHCHCMDCQRLSGSGHTTGAMFAINQFQIEGEVGEFELVSNNGNQVTRVFCPSCGSPIFGRNSGMKGHVTICLGTLDDSSMFEPQASIFTRNKKPWDVMDDTLPSFETQPDWKPGDEV